MKSSELQKSDYNPHYHTYINKIGDANLLESMAKQLKNFPQFIASIPDDKWNYAYDDGKWTIAESLLHIIDTERIFQYRALCFSRKDESHLPGFDQNAYVPHSAANKRTKDSVIEEYKAVRQSTFTLFSTIDEETLKHRGTASGSKVSVGALGFIILGHQRHHRDIIREKYL